MEILLKRDIHSEKSTTGKMYVDGVFECFTLEDLDRGLKSSMPLDDIKKIKVYGQTAIPTGRYEVTTSYSGLFNKEMPLLKGIPGYDQVRIHPGNSDKDTLGCILVGEARTIDWVSNSRAAFARFYPKLKAALEAGQKVFITVQ